MLLRDMSRACRGRVQDMPSRGRCVLLVVGVAIDGEQECEGHVLEVDGVEALLPLEVAPRDGQLRLRCAASSSESDESRYLARSPRPSALRADSCFIR